MNHGKVQTDGLLCWFGKHLLIDIHNIDCGYHTEEFLINVLTEAAFAAGATVLETKIHDFGNGGFSGVLILAESHISIHTWPENKFVAIDIFVCGDCLPEKSIPILKNYLIGDYICNVQKRGLYCA